MNKNIIKKAKYISPWVIGTAVDLGSEDINWDESFHNNLEVFLERDILRVDKYGEPDVKADLNKKFPFQDDSFDTVIASEIIEHMESPLHFLRECKRIVKSNGIIILTTPNAISLAEMMTALKSKLHDKEYVTDMYNWHKGNMLSLVNEAGLAVRDFEYISFYWKKNILFKFIAWMLPFLRPNMLLILERTE